MINRRDLLKAIGIGGILPFVGKTEVEAAPHEVQPQELPTIQPYTFGSVWWSPSVPTTPSGTADMYALVEYVKIMYGGGE